VTRLGRLGPAPKKIKKIKKAEKICACMKNKIYFIGLFTDARVRNKNTDLIVFLFSNIKNKNIYECIIK